VSVAPTSASSDSPSVTASDATVKKAGVGMRSASILRRVSAEMPAVPATSTVLRSPRACRSTQPSRKTVQLAGAGLVQGLWLYGVS
jgi:hypothetical protein